MLDAMHARGIDVAGCRVDPRHETGVSVVLADEERGRAILTARGAMAALEPGEVDRALLRATRHVHCGGYFLQPALSPGIPGLFAEARRHGATCSLDPNWDPAAEWAGVREAIAACDVFLPNEAELLAITGARDVDAAVAELARPGLTIAVKRGAAGGELHRDGVALCLPAPPVEVVDTTGAGDAFDAGLLRALLTGMEPDRQLALAVACGSLAARALGGAAAQPDLHEALAVAATVEPEGAHA
jgi:sugar/nucleoside kinase (ribokinase family)